MNTFNSPHSYLLIFSLFFFLPSNLDAQSRSKKKSKTERHFTIQGGSFYDWEKRESDSFTYDFGKVNFSKLGVGVLKFQNNRVSQILLTASFHNQDSGLAFTPSGNVIRGIKKEALLIEAEYFKSLIKQKELKNNFHIGYLATASFDRKNYLPYATNNYQNLLTCFNVGTGLKAMYIASITKKTMMKLSTKVNLLNMGLERDYHANPNIFADLQTNYGFCFELFRPRIGLDIGFVF